MFACVSDYTVNKLTSMVLYFVSNTCMSWVNFYMCTLIKRKPGFSGKMLWSLEIPFKTGFTICVCVCVCVYALYVQVVGGALWRCG
jgi:hypothetical protein